MTVTVPSPQTAFGEELLSWTRVLSHTSRVSKRAAFAMQSSRASNHVVVCRKRFTMTCNGGCDETTSPRCQTTTQTTLTEDGGSLLPLIIGVIALLLLLVGTVLDIGYARERSIALTNIAENVALAGALGVDTNAHVVETPSNEVVRLPLVARAARMSALQELHASVRDWPGLSLVALRVRNDAVRVRVCGGIVLPVTWDVRVHQRRQLCASAAAAMAVSSRQ